MGRKWKKKGLGLYQSKKKKRRRRHFLTKGKNTDDISTEEYSDNLESTILVENEPIVYESKNDLHEVLGRFTDLSTSILESIDT